MKNIQEILRLNLFLFSFFLPFFFKNLNIEIVQ